MTYLFKQCFRYVYDIHVACTASIQLLFMHSFLQLADNEGNTNVYGQCQIIDPVAMFHLVGHKPIIHVHLHALDSDVKFVCCAAINAPPMDSTGSVATMQSAATASSVHSRMCR